MKKLLSIATLLLLVVTTATAQKSVDNILSTYQSEKGVETVNMGGVMMAFANLFADTNGVKSINVLTLDECSDEVKSSFIKDVNSLDKQGYERLVNQKSKGSKTQILLRIEDEKICELLIVSTGKECLMVRIKGDNLNVDDLKDFKL